MSDNAVINLSNVQESFFDQLKKYEAACVQEGIDPEELANLRLKLIQSAKKSIDDKSSPEAKRWYGYCLATGDEGFPINVDEGIQMLNEAVMMRASNANQHLGDIYSGVVGHLAQEKIDFEKAIKHYEQDDGGYSYYRLARIYSEEETMRDIRKALDFIERSDHLGDLMGKCTLAIWIYDGTYIKKDLDKAYEYFGSCYNEDRQEDGSYNSWVGPSALFFLGLMTFNGEAVNREEHRGYMMIEEAAGWGDTNAIDWLNSYHQKQ